MQRKIAFRAWDKEKNNFFEPTYEAYKGNLEDLHISLAGEVCIRTVDAFSHESMFRGRYILQQYTGLKDKNGKEIYEGDIVKTNTEKPMKIGWSVRHATFVIEREGWAFCHYFGEALEASECEVIGNIYQNRELLNP